MSNEMRGDHYGSLFEYAPISLWEEDYSGIKIFFDDLRAGGVRDLALYLDQHPHEIENCMRRIRVIHVNRESLRMFGASSEAELIEEYPDSELAATARGNSCRRRFSLFSRARLRATKRARWFRVWRKPV